MRDYLTRTETAKLAAILRAIPWLSNQLDTTILRQDRITGTPIPTLATTPSREQPLPYNPAASDTRDHLRNALVGWVRHTLEQRGMTYTGDDTLPGIAAWLHTHIHALALTEGSAQALDDIGRAAASAWTVIDRPDERPRPVDPADVDAARRHILTARGIAALARELGPGYTRLTQARVESLHRGGHITPVHAPTALGCLYLVGDVLDAHLAISTRNRKKVGA